MSFRLDLGAEAFDKTDQALLVARLVHLINEAALRLPPPDDDERTDHVLLLDFLDDRVEATYDQKPLIVIDNAVLTADAFYDDVFWTYQPGTGTTYVTTRDGAQ